MTNSALLLHLRDTGGLDLTLARILPVQYDKGLLSGNIYSNRCLRRSKRPCVSLAGTTQLRPNTASGNAFSLRTDRTTAESLHHGTWLGGVCIPNDAP